MSTAAIALVFVMELKAAVSKDIKCLTNAIYFEARGESLKGKMAVANVIDNRVNDPKFPKTYCDVIHEKNQFSYLWDGIPNKITDKAAFIEARKVARMLVTNKLRDNTNGALFYKKIGIHSPFFNKLKRVKRIENHEFFLAKA